MPIFFTLAKFGIDRSTTEAFERQFGGTTTKDNEMLKPRWFDNVNESSNKID